MPAIADNFFSCKESPANFPTGLKLSAVADSPTSVLRIISKIPGPGNYTGPTDFYFDVNENPTTSIHFNGVMYNLTTCLLCIPGVHRVFGEEKVCDAELVARFKPSQQTSSTNEHPTVLLCIPVESGISMNDNSKRYFSTLTTGVTAKRPTFGSILHPNSKFITYKGFDFMLRAGNNKLISCGEVPDAPTNIIRYLVCQNRIGMTVNDYNRFTEQLAYKPRPPKANDYTPLEQLVKPPTCMNEIASARFTTLVTLIGNVIVESDDGVSGGAKPPKPKGIPIDQMKCKPLRDGKTRVDMTKGTTKLTDEIAKTDAILRDENGDPEMPTEPASSIQPQQVETVLSIFFGIILAVIICAAITFFVQWGVYPNYLKVVSGGEMPARASDIKPFKMPTLPKVELPNIPNLVCPRTE